VISKQKVKQLHARAQDLYTAGAKLAGVEWLDVVELCSDWLSTQALMDAAKRGERTHCQYGHEFTPENTRIRADGWRECVVCYKRRQKQRYNREKSKEAS
jgi:hypothetical protein